MGVTPISFNHFAEVKPCDNKNIGRGRVIFGTCLFHAGNWRRKKRMEAFTQNACFGKVLFGAGRNCRYVLYLAHKLWFWAAAAARQRNPTLRTNLLL